MDLVAWFQCLQPYLTATGCRRFSRMAWAMRVVTGGVTRLGIACWAGTGGRYRTVQRFVAQALPWAALLWAFFRHHLHCPTEVYLSAGDAVMVTNAGKSPHGLDRFVASWYGKPVPGLSFCTVSLVRVQTRRSCPLRVAQVVRRDAEQAVSQANAEATKAKSPRDQRRPGRPQGSPNNKQVAVTCTPELGRINAMRDALRHLMAWGVPLTHLVLAGPCGHHNALAMARQCTVHLMSELRCDAALSFPDTGP